MQIEIKNKLDLNSIQEKAIFIHRAVFETKWFKQRLEVTSSESENIEEEYKKIKDDNILISISGFFQIPSVGYVALTIYKSGLIIAPEDLTADEIKIIEDFLRNN